MCFFFNDTPTTEIYTLSLHDALPISVARMIADQIDRIADGVQQLVVAAAFQHVQGGRRLRRIVRLQTIHRLRDRKSTRLNSSHMSISYAVFCLKKKNTTN